MKRVLLTMVLALASVAAAQVVGAPKVGAAPKWSPPVPEVRSLTNGAKARVLTRQGLPLMNVVAFVPAGSREELPAQAGLASLTAELVHEGGAGSRAPDAFLEALESLGAELNVSPGREGVEFSLTVLSSRFDPAMKLFVEMLSQPKLDATAFESLKARRLAEIASSLDEPRVIASQTLLGALYGDAPEGRPVGGTIASVKALTLDDVKRFHAAHFASAGMTFVLVGDLSADAAKQKLDALAPKSWLQAGTPTAARAPTAAAPRWLAVDKKDAPQTQVMLARPGPKVLGEKFAADELASIVLGGSFTSRLVQNLREKHGYTYGASARSQAARAGGTLLIYSAVKKEVTADAVEQLLLELKGFSSLSRDEVEKARALNQANVIDAFSSGGSVAATLAQDVVDGLGPDGLSKEWTALNTVPVEQVQAAASDFAAEGFMVVLVGDRASLEPALKKKLPEQKVEWVTF